MLRRFLAVVYTSNTGFTAKLAKMLAEQLNVPSYPLSEAKTVLKKNDKIAYLGWLMAGSVKDLSKAADFCLEAVCGVGMAMPTIEERDRIAKVNSSKASYKNESFFLLQGGFDINKLKGLYRFMMKLMVKAISKGLTKRVENGTANESEKEMLDMAINGKDCTSKEAIIPVAEYLKANA